MSNSPRRKIVGAWTAQGGRRVANQECEIISHLVKYHFLKVGEREEGWTVLYRDPTNDTFWERTYPQGEMHGGGPPTLTQLSEGEVRLHYGGVPSQQPH
jgi:Immunity protein 27